MDRANVQQQLEEALGGRNPNKKELLRVLLKLPETKKDVKVFDQSIALFCAREGWWDVIQTLVKKYGCIPSNDETDEMNGNTILHYACEDPGAIPDTIELLTETCLFDPLQKNHDNVTPLDLSTETKKRLLETLIGNSKDSGFNTVIDYLKDKREKSAHQIATKAVSKEHDHVILYKLYITGKPRSGKTSLKNAIVAEPTNGKEKMLVTDFNIDDRCTATVKSMGLFYCNRSHFIVTIQLTNTHSNGINDIHNDTTLVAEMCQLAQGIAVRTKRKFIPKVFIVGTHVDKIKNAKCLHQLNEKLQLLYDTYKDVLVCLPDKMEFVYPIDTTLSGAKRKESVIDLQKHISSAIDKSGEQNKLPLKWFQLFTYLDNDTGIAKISECHEIHKKLAMNPAELKEALTSLDRLMLLHCDPEGDDIVLTRIDPFVKKFCCLFKASLDDRESILRKKGLFKKAFLRISCMGLLSTSAQDVLSDEMFLKLLEKFRIAIRLRENDFFLPSALPIKSQEPELVGSVSSLALLWDRKHILPHGFFLAFVIELNIRGIKDRCKFQPCLDEKQSINEMYLIAEESCKIPGKLKLIDRGNWIQVVYLGQNDSGYCLKVLNIINRAFQQAIKLFQYSDSTPPIIRCICPLCKENDHWCYVYRTQCYRSVICGKNPRNTGPLESNTLCWLQEGEKLSKDETSIIARLHPEKDDLPVDSRMLIDSSSQDLLDVIHVFRDTFVENWSTLGLCLGLKSYSLSIIKTDGHDAEDKIEKLATEWLSTGNASWKSLVLALHDPLIKQIQLAEEICKQHLVLPE